MGKHKNSNDAVGNFCIYQIMIKGKIYKVGKADYDRITASTNIPTRIHQQIRILSKTYGKKRVRHKIIKELFGVTTLQAKSMERKLLRLIYEDSKKIPIGNSKSFKP